jgi:RHS repeat-associated protein
VDSSTNDRAYADGDLACEGGAANANSYQFTGRENNGTGLYYYRARYYSPTYQRFIAQDPMGFPGGDPDLYGYVYGDPVNLTDPPGLWGFGFTLGESAEGVREWVQQGCRNSVSGFSSTVGT